MSHDESLLGAVLSGYPDVPSLARVVTADDFEQAWYGAAWDACLRVHKRGEYVEPQTVAEEMKGFPGFLPDGPLRLFSLSQEVNVTVNAPWYADRVRSDSLKRKMRDVGHRMIHYAENDAEATPAEMASEVRRWVDEVGTVTHHQTTMTELLEQVIDTAEHGEPYAVTTPWPSLDEFIGGFYPGQLVTFAARPGVGKSIALLAVGKHMASGGHVAFCTLEMYGKEVTQRLVADVAKVSLSKLRKGQCDDDDWARIALAKSQIEAMPLHFQDRRPQTTDDIRAHAWEVSQQAKRAGSRLSAVVVDYVQIIRSASTSKHMSRQQQVGQVTQDLKNLAGELEVPLVMAAQLNRSAAKEKPDLSHLREAGDIENDSDTVILMHEDMVEDGNKIMPTGDMTMMVAKSRSGRRGEFTLKKYGHYSRLSER